MEELKSTNVFLVEAWQGRDSAGKIAATLFEQDGRVPLVALFLHDGHDGGARVWLDTFSDEWAEMAEKAGDMADPWGRLKPLPLVVVDSEGLPPECREDLLSWGVSSFVSGEAEGLANRLSEVSNEAADELGLKGGQPAEAGEPQRVQEDSSEPHPAPSAEVFDGPDRIYMDVLNALNALGQNRERED